MTSRTEFFQQTTPLTEDHLRRRVPSIFNDEASPDRSDRFQAIPTIEAVRLLAKDGFQPFAASQSHCRSKENKPYAKHMLRFRQTGPSAKSLSAGDSILEVILSNANDGTKAYQLDTGFYRIVCMNGLVTKSKDFGSVKIRHTGMDTLYRVLQGTHDIIKNAERVLAAPRDWAKLMVDDDVRDAFALAAHRARFGENEQRIAASQLLIPRRPADMGRDLWTLFNVVQENTVEGGLSATRDPNASRQWTTRRVSAVDSNLRLNQQLWQLAESVAHGRPLAEKVAA
jgi:hypothetical protein